jgi:hypothetical protein
MTISDSEGFWNGEVACSLCGKGTINRVSKICDDCQKEELVDVGNMNISGNYIDGTTPVVISTEGSLVQEKDGKVLCRNVLGLQDHELGTNPRCAFCSTHNTIKQVNEMPDEYSQITPETLQGGFKAADSKATFDLLPPDVFSLFVNTVMQRVKTVKYDNLMTTLQTFWKNPELDQLQIIQLLNQALVESFHLLVEQTGSEVDALFAVGELYAIGKKKYAARNWEKGIDWGIVYSAAWRHLLKHVVKGELTDPVDGQLHLTSVVWNVIALRFYATQPEKYKKFDSRLDVTVAKNKGQK